MASIHAEKSRDTAPLKACTLYTVPVYTKGPNLYIFSLSLNMTGILGKAVGYSSYKWGGMPEREMMESLENAEYL